MDPVKRVSSPKSFIGDQHHLDPRLRGDDNVTLFKTSVLAAVFLLILLGKSSAADSAKDNPFKSIHGFMEAAYGPKLDHDGLTQKDDFNLLEQRLQLKTSYRPDQSETLARWNTEFFYKGDLLVDEHEETVQYDIREANGVFSPFSWLDVKLGRHILTWGTGDLLFINDVFPKDFESFFIGRDDEYLKVPSDAGRFSLYNPLVSADLVLVPFFTPDTPLDGDRLSFYDVFLGRLAGKESGRLLTVRRLLSGGLSPAKSVTWSLWKIGAAEIDLLKTQR